MPKILIFSANPIDTAKLRLDEEVREIQSSLERSKSQKEVELITRWAVRIDDLRRALLDYEPQIVHFSGHGAGTDGIALENNSGQAQLVNTESLANLFKLCEDTVECVLLNACYSQTQAEAIHRYIDCVIGMKNPIQDNAAINFSKGFYDAIFAGKTYVDAFDFGCNNIDLNNIPESFTPKIHNRHHSKTLFYKNQSTTKPMEPQPSQSFTISGSHFSGAQIGQAGGNITQTQQNTQGKAEKQLTPTEVVELIAQMESLFLNSNLSDISKKQALKHLDYAKDAVEEQEPDKFTVATCLQKATKVLKSDNDTLDANQGIWKKLKPIVNQLASWLEIDIKSLLP